MNTHFSEMKILLPIVLALVFLTDSFDGQIARRTNQITKIGQMLDSISDYSLLVVISVVYYRNEIVPLWFFARITSYNVCYTKLLRWETLKPQ